MTLSEYLIRGALIQILRTNSDGSSRPVWIMRDHPLGEYHYGFSSEGGRVPPFDAARGNKISLLEKDAVTAYLQTFGLSRPEAEHVVEQIGTDPAGL